MSLQFLKLFSGQSAPVSHLAVPLHVPHRTHAGNDGRYRLVTQNKTQRRFSHLIQGNIKIRSNLLHARVDLLLPITPEISVAEIVRCERGIRRYFPSQCAFIQCHADDNPNLMTFTRRKVQILRALLEDIVNDLDSVHGAGFN